MDITDRLNGIDMYAVNPQSMNMQTSSVFRTDPTQKKATLYLFSRRDQYDTYKRPLTYDNLNSYEFLNSCLDRVNTQSVGTIQYGPHLVESITNLPQAKSVVIPSYDGININTGQLSYNWMFMLIIDNDDKSAMSKLYNNNAPRMLNRCIYYGICIDEPVNLVNMGGGGYTPNYNATLVITHKTILGQYDTFGPNGSMHRTTNMADVDIVPTAIVQSMANDNLLSITPSSLIDKMAIFEDSDYPNETQALVTIDPDDSIAHKDTQLAISVENHVPIKHTKKLLNGVLGGIAHSNAELVTTGNTIIGYPEEASMYTLSSIGGALADNSNPNLIGLNTNTPLLMAYLIETYNPDIVPVITPTTAQYDVIPQQEMTLNNVWSSVIAEAMPAIMGQLGLCSVAFMYNSVYDAFALGNIEAFTYTTPAVMQTKANALSMLLQKDLFDTIKFNVGNFDLNCSCSTGGYSQIQLTLLDFGGTDRGAFYENNNLLGGVNTPMIANASTCNKNANSLGSFINQFTHI